MGILNFELFLRILVAHLLSDFIFQPTLWAKKKDEQGLKSLYFWLHIGITAITLFILLWNWNLWTILIWITSAHFIIDAIKSKLPNSNVWIFVADQLLHLVIITFVWLLYTKQFQLFCEIVSTTASYSKFWWLLIAYLLLSMPSSVLIGKLTQKWSDELDEHGTDEKKKTGLKDAGKWIGIIERLIIVTFIIIGEFSVIGFLLAAKSVFRFGDLKDASDQKKTEYIIIGTFLSFSSAIAIGLTYRHFAN